MKPKKLLSFLLATAMTISLLPTFTIIVSAETTYNGQKIDDTGLYYDFNGEYYRIADCDENAKNVMIPSSVNGYAIKAIKDSAFKNCTNLESITIPESITFISYNAFEGCTSLKEIKIPESVTEISSSTFKDCTSLAKITLHDNITDIEYNAFSNTGYYNDASNWQDGVLYIDKYLIDTKKDQVPEKYTIKDGTTFIAQQSFEECTTIKSVTIGESVKCICDYAFLNCTNLKDITILNDNISIGNKAFKLTAYYKDLTNWEKDLLYIGNHLVSESGSAAGDITIKNGTKTIAANTFYTNENITGVQLPSGLLRIGKWAFYGCTKLDNVTIPESVTDMGEQIFYKCTSLKTAKINSMIVGEYMFWNCTNLTSVEFGEKVKNIGHHAFYECSLLESIEIPNNIDVIGDNVFSGCTSLKNISILNGNINIGTQAFSRCNSLTDIDFLPKTITSIGYGWFYQCSGFVNLNIPSHITDIGNWVFYSCSNLKSVKLPDGVTVLDEYAFYNCEKLESIYIPKSVTSIGKSALRYCNALTQINYEGTEAEWNAISIDSSNDSIKSNIIKYNYVQTPSTTVSENTFTVTGNSSINDCTVILALYKDDGQGNSQLADCKTAIYSGTPIQFTTTAIDYTSAKVMVWNNLTNIVPVTEVEIVNLEQSN